LPFVVASPFSLSLQKNAFFFPYLDVDALRVDLRADRLHVDQVGRDRDGGDVGGEADGAELEKKNSFF